MQFMSMRYPHPETIRELGIEEDVNDILYYTELGEFTKLALSAYREPAIEFLASLKLKKHPQEAVAELKRDGIGYITFTLLGQEHLFSMLKMETIYKLEEDRGLDTKMYVPATELHALWRMISSRFYQISKNKSGHIKNPAIRYAHKKLETLDDGEEIKGDLRQTSKAVVMVNSFMHVMRNAELSYEQGKIKEAHLVIGSLITPILLATKVKLPAPSHPPTFMDLAYLNKTWFLRGMHDGKHVYRFEHPTFGISKVLLPNVELTNTNTREGILFLPTADQLFMDGGDATVEEEQGGEEGETSERRPSELGEFDFIPYNASGSVPAIIKAHEHIGMLQKWCKKQDEVIKKLTETVNVLKEKLSCKSPKAPKAADIPLFYLLFMLFYYGFLVDSCVKSARTRSPAGRGTNVPRSAKTVRPTEVSAKVQNHSADHASRPGKLKPAVGHATTAAPQPRTTKAREPGSNASRPRNSLTYHADASVRAGKLSRVRPRNHRPNSIRPTTPADRHNIRPRPFRLGQRPDCPADRPDDRPNAAVDPKPFLKPNPHNSSPKPAPT
ncbi:unnamed protein product [Microthlaspi erraticum]|uniref:Arabidopsis retrotransposon Orf1 C-terminal domain-containing protein n=1 Tax=Microthlaspi erraticum TaxID=1685480 RepID=A0A6D2JNL8_9BRAS|nr:unnamed protein product [Microthlaspi erraticum]